MQWSNSYDSPIAGDTSSFGWLCWLMLIDSTLYFIIGAYVRVVFPGNFYFSDNEMFCLCCLNALSDLYQIFSLLVPLCCQDVFFINILCVGYLST